jgi:hypothetical protein
VDPSKSKYPQLADHRPHALRFSFFLCFLLESPSISSGNFSISWFSTPAGMFASSS